MTTQVVVDGPPMTIAELVDGYVRLLEARHEQAHNGDVVSLGGFERCVICRPAREAAQALEVSQP